MRLPLAVLAGVLALTGASCAARSVISGHECADPDRALHEAIVQLEDARGARCSEHGRAGSCVTREREIERLALVCPAHTLTMVANAVLAYERRNPAQSQQYLDRVRNEPSALPDAVMLRARIAIDEGNLPFARRVLAEQIRLRPDHAGLREVYGAALYLSGDLDGATRELQVAQRMGAPAWRVAYHLGLIDEAAGLPDAAREHYAASVAANPTWLPARSRLTALEMAGPSALPLPPPPQ